MLKRERRERGVGAGAGAGAPAVAVAGAALAGLGVVVGPVLGGESTLAERWLRDARSAAEAVDAWVDSQADRVRGDLETAMASARAAYLAQLGMWTPCEAAAGDDAEGDGACCVGISCLRWVRVSEAFGPAHGGAPERVVVLVHGLDEPGDIWDDLIPELRGAGYRVVQVVYRNDQSARDSADELRRALDGLGAVGVERADLICHSMGGLIACDVLTADGAAAEGRPTIERFITVGTPWGGSALASLQLVSEARDQALRIIASRVIDTRAVMGSMFDGESEAATDLMPGSEYLEELRGRGLPEDVAMTVLIGRWVSVEGAGQAAEKVLDDTIAQGLARVAADAAAWAERQLGEVGDGVVPVGSATLEGVDDQVVLAANHRSMVRRIAVISPGPPPGIPVILDRLARPASCDAGANAPVPEAVPPAGE